MWGDLGVSRSCSPRAGSALVDGADAEAVGGVGAQPRDRAAQGGWDLTRDNSCNDNNDNDDNNDSNNNDNNSDNNNDSSNVININK